MKDLAHWIGADLTVSASGDLAVSEGSEAGVQRVLRRLLTCVRGDVWHPEYGAGLPQRVGDVVSVAQLTGLVRQQMGLEQSVARTPAPVIEVRPITDGVWVRIQYTDARTQDVVTRAFRVTR